MNHTNKENHRDKRAKKSSLRYIEPDEAPDILPMMLGLLEASRYIVEAEKRGREGNLPRYDVFDRKDELEERVKRYFYKQDIPKP